MMFLNYFEAFYLKIKIENKKQQMNSNFLSNSDQLSSKEIEE